MEKALGELESSGISLKGLVLDLRNNGGGLLNQSIKVADLFLDEGNILSIKGRNKKNTKIFKASPSGIKREYPLVVLINGGSASASEIVAGALQDHKRALILGTTSFGKGSVQTVIPLSDGSAIRLTTSKYFSPNGQVIHGEGVVPDIIVQEGKIKLLAEDEKAVKDIFQELEEVPIKDELKEQIPEEYKDDNQLMRAMDVLRAIKIYHHLG